MRNPQTVSLTWKPFPESKPKEAGYYYVQDRKMGIMPAYWSKNKRRFSGLRLVVGIPAVGVLWNIIAYAELPEPYREDTKSEKPDEYQSTHIPTAGNGEPVMWD